MKETGFGLSVFSLWVSSLSKRTAPFLGQAKAGTRRWFAAVVLLAFLGCAALPPRRELTSAIDNWPSANPDGYLKAHARDGRLVLFSTFAVDEAARLVSGEGRVFSPGRRLEREGKLEFSVDEFSLVETHRPTRSVALAPLAIVGAVSLVTTGVCVANPKACFGSCPTFYAEDDRGGRVLMAEGFSESISPALEATDLDALFRARSRQRRFMLEMTNEAMETHVVRSVNLLAARRPAGGRVLANAAGELWQVGLLQAPDLCRAEEGDCRRLVLDADGKERFSRTDGKDLGRREFVDLTFEAPARGPLGLVIGARQTLLSTYLLYQVLSYMGNEAGHWLARVERGDRRLRGRAQGLRAALGGIEVQVGRGDGRFTRVAEILETGPLASDVKFVPLPRSKGGPLRVRLRLTRGHWRLDQIALTSLIGPVRAERLSPVSVRGGPKDSEPHWPLTTLPGDRYEFIFDLPPEPEGLELFLETRGYYLEWMRDEWVLEESRERLFALLRHPRRALRELAREFHAREPALEEAFWKSRYVGAPQN